MTYNFSMTRLKEKDFIRKVRNGKEEVIVSLSKEFLELKGLEVGDYLDLRNLKKSSSNGSQKKVNS